MAGVPRGPIAGAQGALDELASGTIQSLTEHDVLPDLLRWTKNASTQEIQALCRELSAHPDRYSQIGRKLAVAQVHKRSVLLDTVKHALTGALYAKDIGLIDLFSELRTAKPAGKQLTLPELLQQPTWARLVHLCLHTSFSMTEAQAERVASMLSLESHGDRLEYFLLTKLEKLLLGLEQSRRRQMSPARQRDLAANPSEQGKRISAALSGTAFDLATKTPRSQSAGKTLLELMEVDLAPDREAQVSALLALKPNQEALDQCVYQASTCLLDAGADPAKIPTDKRLMFYPIVARMADGGEETARVMLTALAQSEFHRMGEASVPYP
jgi:hypothetical protein